MKSILCGLCGLCVLLTIATAPGRATEGGAELGVKDRASANASLAASAGLAAIAWSASTTDGLTDIVVSVSRDGGRTFTAPARVNQAAGNASASGEQPPRVTLVPQAGRDPSIVVVWTAKGTAGTRLLSAKSEDGGRTFGPSVAVPGSEAAGNRGWESIATTQDGGVAALWLDHRELAAGRPGAPAMDHARHLHEASAAQETDGVARAQLSKLFFSRLENAGSARAIAGGVCYCCKTTIAAGADGALYAAWRHVYQGNLRDIAFTMSTDGGQSFAAPIRVSEDRWVLDGCPENGPALAVDGRHIHVVWPTLVPGDGPGAEPALALFHASSTDGRRFTPRQVIPTEGVPRHAQIGVDGHGDITVVWDEQIGGTRRIALARAAADDSGTLRFVRQTIGDGTHAVYPVVASTGDSTLLAWTSGTGRTTIRALRLQE